MIDKSIAVIVNGCIRPHDCNKRPDVNVCLDDFTEYKQVILQINTLLSDFKTVHIYYHTWNPFPETNIRRHEYSYKQDTFIEEVKRIPNVYSMLFEEQYTTEQLDSLGARHTQSVVNSNYDCKVARTSIYNCFKAFNSLCNAIKTSGNHYDYIVRTRNDLLIEFTDFKTVISKADENYLCVPPNCWCVPRHEWYSPHIRSINDHWVFGKTDALMSGICFSTFEEFTQVVGNSYNAEEITKTYFRKSNCPLYITPVKSYMILHEHRKLI